MTITFLIGNGFDRNLGLKTTYSDFVKAYKGTNADTETLRKFRKYISENEELWSAAEEEMGRYTAEFETGNGGAFFECHNDFCENLASYLKLESTRIEYPYITQEIESAFSALNSLSRSFPTQEREKIDAVFSKRLGENITFNFLVYNYTDTLDQCVNLIRNKPEVWGKHQYNSRTYNHTLGKICHVHGTVDAQMVFGVNDESQIAKPDVFDCEFGNLYEDLLIKKRANQGYQENTDTKALTILNSSQIIDIYGMSIGVTDALWWERICAWLNDDSGHHLIIHRHSMPPKGINEVFYKIEETKTRQRITSFCQLSDDRKRVIEKRIHITGENLFAELKDIAVKEEIAGANLGEIYSSALNAVTNAHGERTQNFADEIDKYNAENPKVVVV